MKIIVCVKRVAALEDDVEFTPDERDVDHDYLDFALNEWDSFATEEALQIRERAGEGEVVVLTVGDEDAEEALRHCLAMGADRAVRIEPAGADPLTLARVLADAIRSEQPDLVLCGVQSSDAAHGATGTALAELLDLPRVAVVSGIRYEPGAATATVDRELEGGVIDVVEVDMPALLTVQTGINEPRYVTLRALKQAEQVDVDVRPAPDDGQPGHVVRRMFLPPKGEGAEMLDGSPS
ncbi:MAG: electron transfer flavoprotein beta subunit, partial [Thermoleophilaceae bacterium]|nr:electron transfer flavoprotein beta subunit [Thermoleophilaceae bacterium]